MQVSNKGNTIKLLKLHRLIKLHRLLKLRKRMKQIPLVVCSLVYFPCVRQKLQPLTCIRSLSSRYLPIGSSSLP